ncbi:MAG TPA: thiamine-phosphate kinase [Rhodocyclaceae bacterium]|nr:thiamine-phosphate kinase [Rhodocyclaceae bacterium]
MTSEFELIRRFFTRTTAHSDLGVGDDAALFRARPNMQLAVSTDVLVAGTHFFPDTEPEALGWKTAAVNISDMAAMAAEPRWMLLALSLPEVDDMWIARFSSGFSMCCAEFGVDWIGGDTTRGPLNLCATIIGEVPQGRSIRRSSAKVGDDIWISGNPGLAALGLQHLQGNAQLDDGWRDTCLDALHRPQPRVALGIALRGIANAMLDVSDGLLGDLGHILEQSCCGAEIEESCLPLAKLTEACNDIELARKALFSGGDDYELLFTAAAPQRAALKALSDQCVLPVTRIGSITNDSSAIWLISDNGSRQQLAAAGYDHFAGDNG